MENYVNEKLVRLEEILGGKYPELLDLYTLLVLVKGVGVSLKDVHDAWAVWKNRAIRNGEISEHKSLVIFEELTKEIQDLDYKYAVAIQMAAIS